MILINHSLTAKIVSHVCYRDVFNAAVSIDNLKKWLLPKNSSLEEFSKAIEQLKKEELIEEKNGYLVSYGNIDLINQQEEKNQLTEKLITKGEKFLNLFAKLPFVKFIGISGSLAADNPTLDKNGLNKGKVDMDLFVISTANTLWILFLIERIFSNLHKLIFRHHFYCFNYVTDESFLEIHNKNFYTATEIVNMKPVYDDGIYHLFLQQNVWHRLFYANSIDSSLHLESVKPNILMRVFIPINYVCFVLFCIGRATKRLEIQPILEIRGKFNPKHKTNLKRIANSNGGYQEAIRNRFEEIFESKFPNYYSEELISDLFPKSDSFHFTTDNIYDAEISDLFKKYA